jgi:hypothetical protein
MPRKEVEMIIKTNQSTLDMLYMFNLDPEKIVKEYQKLIEVQKDPFNNGTVYTFISPTRGRQDTIYFLIVPATGQLSYFTRDDDGVSLRLYQQTGYHWEYWSVLVTFVYHDQYYEVMRMQNGWMDLDRDIVIGTEDGR